MGENIYMYLSGSVQLGSMERLVPTLPGSYTGPLPKGQSSPATVPVLSSYIPSDWVNVPLKTQSQFSSDLDSTAKTLLYLLKRACSKSLDLNGPQTGFLNNS